MKKGERHELDALLGGIDFGRGGRRALRGPPSDEYGNILMNSR